MKLAVKCLGNVGLFLAAVGLVVMMCLIVTEVVARRIANVSILISFEYSGYLMAFITFLGGAYSLRTGGFVRVSVLYDRTKGNTRHLLESGINATAFAYTTLLSFYCWKFIFRSYVLGTLSISVTETPLWIPQLFMGIGMTLLALELLMWTVNDWILLQRRFVHRRSQHTQT